MASNSETGHAKNVSNFEKLISICTGYGAPYNPFKVSIALTALGILHTAAKAILVVLTTAGTAFINATNARQIAFAPVKALATRLINALIATDASDELIADAKTINRKIQGARKGGNGKPVTPPAEGAPLPDDKQISVSQQSYDSLLENFKKLIDLVISEPTYKPNEVDLQEVTLLDQVKDLQKSNSDVIAANTAISNARIERNKLLYLDKTGLVDVAGDVKSYVKSVFKANSPEYKQISKIKFTRQK